MTNNFLLIIVFFFKCSAFSQHQELSKELTLLSVTDRTLFPILDSMISSEQKCKYYNDSLFFTIHIRNIYCDSIHLINIQSNNNLRIALNLEPDGYLYYAKHLFMIYGFKEGLFFATSNNKKVFTCSEFILNSKRDTLVTNLEILNDSFTIWRYYYIDNKFILQDKSSSCN